MNFHLPARDIHLLDTRFLPRSSGVPLSLPPAGWELNRKLSTLKPQADILLQVKFFFWQIYFELAYKQSPKKINEVNVFMHF